MGLARAPEEEEEGGGEGEERAAEGEGEIGAAGGGRGVGAGKVEPEGGAEDSEDVGRDPGAGEGERLPEEDGGDDEKSDVQGLAFHPGLILGHRRVSYALVHYQQDNASCAWRGSPVCGRGARHIFALVRGARVVSAGSTGFQPAHGRRHDVCERQIACPQRPAGWKPTLPVNTRRQREKVARTPAGGTAAECAPGARSGGNGGKPLSWLPEVSVC